MNAAQVTSSSRESDTIPATSQLDRLISMTAINVLAGSRAMRDRLKSFNVCMGGSIGSRRTMDAISTAPPHSIFHHGIRRRASSASDQMAVRRGRQPDTAVRSTNTIVIFTADNGAWQDAWPDAGTHPFRGEKGSPFEAGWRVPGIMWWLNHIPAGAQYG